LFQQQGVHALTLDQVKIVQDSFQKVVPIAATAADMFYDQLFAISPEVRPLFPDNLAEQKKKLIGMLSIAVTNLHQADKIIRAVQDLGKRHVAYGVTDKHYESVGTALLWTLEQGLGAEFTEPVKTAWTEAYATLAGVMKSAAATMPVQAVG
jgi:hemoglobin-like flavoprotein